MAYQTQQQEAEERLKTVIYDLQRSKAVAIYYKEEAKRLRRMVSDQPEESERKAPSGISTDDASRVIPIFDPDGDEK